jgi:hypothetical protein
MTVATRHDAPIPNFGFSFEAVLCVFHAALNEIRWLHAQRIKKYIDRGLFQKNA